MMDRVSSPSVARKRSRPEKEENEEICGAADAAIGAGSGGGLLAGSPDAGDTCSEEKKARTTLVGEAAVAYGDGTGAAGQPADAKPPRAANRCLTCRKKVGLTGFRCRCRGTFCGVHRYPDMHDCDHDYKSVLAAGAAATSVFPPVPLAEKKATTTHVGSPASGVSPATAAATAAAPSVFSPASGVSPATAAATAAAPSVFSPVPPAEKKATTTRVGAIASGVSPATAAAAVPSVFSLVPPARAGAFASAAAAAIDPPVTAAVRPADAEPPKAASRCRTCHRKVGLTGFLCRCEGTFCGVHRYSDRHDCDYDFKTAEREKIAKQNPVVIADKITRF